MIQVIKKIQVLSTKVNKGFYDMRKIRVKIIRC